MTDRRPPDLWFLDDGRILGGGQRFALRLARYVRECHPERVVTIVCPAGTELAGVAERDGFPVISLEFPDPALGSLRRLGRAARRLRAALQACDPDELVLVGNSARAQAVAMLACGTLRRHPPLVNLMHEQDSAGRRSVRITHRRAGRVVAVGTNASVAYSAAVGAERVTALNNFLLPAEQETLGARRPADPVTGRPVLGVLARLIPEKGVLEAIVELAACPDVWDRLVVGGPAQDPAYAGAVDDAIRAGGLGGRVDLVGDVDDVPGFLNDIDVLLVPSVGNEGQPTTVLEGLAAGRAVVVRAPVWSRDYDGLSVAPYTGSTDLGAALARAVAGPPASAAVLAERFGPEQALEAIDRAAGVAAGIA